MEQMDGEEVLQSLDNLGYIVTFHYAVEVIGPKLAGIG